MKNSKAWIVESPIGQREIDHSGSPVGVVRMDPAKSYPGIGELLQESINHSSREAWEKIRDKIDYTYRQLDFALSSLEKETGFGGEVKARIEKGLKLLFKPNLVSNLLIDPQTHGPDRSSTTCTGWGFVAALMRWFHDKLGIRYSQMALGEAGTFMPAAASLLSRLHPEGKRVTPEATIEGKCGEFYGGWGFYFARQYLKESAGAAPGDDPMRGFEESVTGTYIPPGQVTDQLMVYDLNRIFDDPAKGREVEVPEGINFKSITLHKVVVGGDPRDPKDRKTYPGCILINVPKLKVHAITLFTNSLKNLGIGLYPMQSTKAGGHAWEYSVPHTAIPGMKGGLPHQVWVPETDPETGFPRRDSAGSYIVQKTGGITATMMDVIRAVQSQGISMLHVVDAVEAINHDHQGVLPGTREAEGLVFAGVDPVATDLLCARYLFSNVPLEEASGAGLDDGTGGSFPQRVPIPAVEGTSIVTRMGYDCPLSRDTCLANAEKRGVGKRAYYVVGRDDVADRPLVSLQGHLGTVDGGVFSGLVTRALYFDMFKMAWDLQKTTFQYLAAVDQLSGSSLKNEFLEEFDEDGDGIVTYEEFGKKGVLGLLLHLGGDLIHQMGTEPYGYLRGPFTNRAKLLKAGESSWNAQGHDLFRVFSYGAACLVAYRMSQMESEGPDPFCPGLTWGKGKWPSFKLAWYIYLGTSLYGIPFPFGMGNQSLYGLAFLYADQTQNGGRYSGEIRNQPIRKATQTYFQEVSSGREKPLDFTLHIPAGYDKIAGSSVPNVEVTVDPARILTASFSGGREIWAGEKG